MKVPWGRSMEEARATMVRDDLRGRGIRDPAVLRAMEEVAREEFIPARLASVAYADHPLPIAGGQTISQPYIVAYMTEALELASDDRVLEIGTGSGYAAAILSRIVERVYTIERLGSLAASAQERLSRLGYSNIVVQTGDGTRGWSDHAPYDAIVVSAGAPRVPEALLDQLEIGGRLVIPVGLTTSWQMLRRIRRVSATDYRSEELCPVRFVPLIGMGGW